MLISFWGRMYCAHLEYTGNLCSRVAPSKLFFICTHGRETFFCSVGPRYKETLKDLAALLIFPNATALILLFLLQRRFCRKCWQSPTQDWESCLPVSFRRSEGPKGNRYGTILFSSTGSLGFTSRGSRGNKTHCFSLHQALKAYCPLLQIHTDSG